MTHDSEEFEYAEPIAGATPVAAGGFTRMDKIVAALVLVALISPFAARFIGGSGETRQVAEVGEVSDVRPIDIAMGHKEAQAEAAFFEGLGQPQSIMAGSAESELDFALAQDEWANVAPVPPVIEPLVPAEETPQSVETNVQEVAASKENPDQAGSGDIWSRPKGDILPAPKIVKEQVEVVVVDEPERKQATAPPDMTPVPGAHPRRSGNPVIGQQSMIRLTDPSEPVIITQAPLAPLPPAGLTQVAMAPSMVQPLQVTDAPANVPNFGPSNGVRPRIALVITAAGLNEDITKSAIQSLPSGITLAFAPVRKEAAALAAQAKRDGHTVLVEIPMEPVNKSRDPGPMTLRVTDSAQANVGRLNQALARIPAASGASSYLGARFSANEAAAGPVVQSLASRGMFVFENQPTERSVLQRLSARSNLPYARGTFVIDHSKSATDIRNALDTLEKRARKTGAAIGVGSALRETVSTLALWVKEAQKRGVEFVPITEIRR